MILGIDLGGIAKEKDIRSRATSRSFRLMSGQKMKYR